MTAPALDCLPHLTAAALGCGADSKAPALVSGVQAPALPVSATANVLRNVLRNVLGDVLRIPYFGFRTSDSVLRIPYVVSGTYFGTYFATYFGLLRNVLGTYVVRTLGSSAGPPTATAKLNDRSRNPCFSLQEAPVSSCTRLRHCCRGASVTVVAAEVRRYGCLLLLLLLLLLLWCCHHQ